MSPTVSRVVTAALLAGAVVLAIVALSMRERTAAPDAAAASEYKVLPAPFAAGTLTGRVFVGGTSGRADLVLSAGPGCAPRSLVEPSSGGLAATVVAIENVHAGIAPSETGPALTLDRCGLSPAVSIGTEGTTATVAVPSGEHRLQATLGDVRVFDATTVGTTRIALLGEGLWNVRCATNHPWEQAWISVEPTPYATVTDAHGRFRFTAVPAGRYRLRLWNPLLGEKSAEALVEVNRTETVDIPW